LIRTDTEVIFTLNGTFEIKLRNVHPRLLIEKLPTFIDLIISGKFNHITIAIQHGSNRILRLMNRYYNIEDYKFALNSQKTSLLANRPF